MTKISIIVAAAENNVIGKDNNLLWHIPDDLKRFKNLTTHHTIVMGNNTYLSLPFKPLPKRRSIVITRNKENNYHGCEMAYSIEEALNLLDTNEENFIIGGEIIYKAFIKYADKIYLTKVNKSFEGDTFFPEINMDDWTIEKTENLKQITPEPMSFSYITFIKKQ